MKGEIDTALIFILFFRILTGNPGQQHCYGQNANCPIQKQNLIKTHKPVDMLLLLGTVPEGGGVVDPEERKID